MSGWIRCYGMLDNQNSEMIGWSEMEIVLTLVTQAIKLLKSQTGEYSFCNTNNLN